MVARSLSPWHGPPRPRWWARWRRPAWAARRADGWRIFPLSGQASPSPIEHHGRAWHGRRTRPTKFLPLAQSTSTHKLETLPAARSLPCSVWSARVVSRVPRGILRRPTMAGGWSGERGAAAAVWDSDAVGMLRVFALALWPLLRQSWRRRELFPILELWNGEGQKSCVHFPSRKRAMPRCWLPLFSPMHAKAEVVSHTCDRPASSPSPPRPSFSFIRPQVIYYPSIRRQLCLRQTFSSAPLYPSPNHHL